MFTNCKNTSSTLSRTMQSWLAALAITALCVTTGIANAQAPTLVTTELPDATFSQPYRQSLFVGGNLVPYSVTVDGLPAGLTANHNGKGSVTISGTPLAAGYYALKVTAIGEETMTATVGLTINSWFQRPPPTTALSTGGSHSCALIRGVVQCWGDNALSQLGNVSANVNSISSDIVNGLSNRVTAISAGWAHNCAVDSGGVLCWGLNTNSQLGGFSVLNGSQFSFLAVMAVALNSGATAVSAGQAHSCAVVNGGVQCWGANNFGQLGNGSTTSITTHK